MTSGVSLGLSALFGFLFAMIIVMILAKRQLRGTKETFVGESSAIAACPQGSKAYTTEEGYTQCCAGTLDGKKCLGDVICTFSENTQQYPKCTNNENYFLMIKDGQNRRAVVPKNTGEFYQWGTGILNIAQYKQSFPQLFTGGTFEKMKSQFQYQLKDDQVINKGTGRCLDSLYGRNNIGNPLIFWPCHGGHAQRFRMLPTGQIQYLSDPGKCVTAVGPWATTENSFNLQKFEQTSLVLQECNAKMTGQIFQKSLGPSLEG